MVFEKLFSAKSLTKQFVLYIVAICFLFFIPIGLNAQEIKDIDPEYQKVINNEAGVFVDGEFLFQVKGIASFSAQKRASIIEARIVSAASNYAIHPDSVRIISLTDRVQVFAGSVFILNIFEIDAKSEGISRESLALLVKFNISKAIRQYRFERSSPVLIKNFIWTFGAFLLLLVTIFILIRIVRKLNLGLQRKIKAKIDSVENISFNLIRSNQLWNAVALLFRAIRTVLIIIAVAVFLQYTLALFPWTHSFASYALHLVLDPVTKIGFGIIKFTPSLIFLIIIYFSSRYVLSLIKLFFSGIEQGGIVINGFDKDWSSATYKIVRLFVVLIALVIAFPYIPGSDTSAFKGLSVFIGVLFSLGSSSFISNLIAGYSMTYRAAFKKGDRIKVDEIVGFVEEQKLLVTRLRSLKNEEIIIPNSALLNSNIMNYSTLSKGRGLIIHTTVGIGYETPWRQVDAMLMLAADKTNGLLKDPAPFVLKHSLGDFAVNYEINAYCVDASKLHLYYNELIQNILDVFNENNVQIMTPAYESDPESPKLVPKDQWDSPLVNES